VPSELLANSERKTGSRFLAVVVVNISLFLEKFCDPLAARVMIIKSSFPEEPAARGPFLVRGPPNMYNTKINNVVFHTLFRSVYKRLHSVRYMNNFVNNHRGVPDYQVIVRRGPPTGYIC